jgi:hypothetical protein
VDTLQMLPVNTAQGLLAKSRRVPTAADGCMPWPPLASVATLPPDVNWIVQ